MKNRILTILIVILYILLGRYLITLEDSIFLRILLNLYSGVFLVFFTYGVYKLITIDEDKKN